MKRQAAFGLAALATILGVALCLDAWANWALAQQPMPPHPDCDQKRASSSVHSCITSYTQCSDVAPWNCNGRSAVSLIPGSNLFPVERVSTENMTNCNGVPTPCYKNVTCSWNELFFECEVGTIHDQVNVEKWTTQDCPSY